MATGAWTWYEAIALEPRHRLTETQRMVAAICDLRQEVNSGGFDRYLSYSGGNTAPLALEALPKVLGEAWADLLRRAMAVLGEPYPVEPGRREHMLFELDVADELDALDDQFYELESSTNADALVDAFLAGG